MASATINIKKASVKKALCAMKVKGVKAKSMIAIGDEVISEVDFKNPKDLYEVGLIQESMTGKEFKVDELLSSLLPGETGK